MPKVAATLEAPKALPKAKSKAQPAPRCEKCTWAPGGTIQVPCVNHCHPEVRVLYSGVEKTGQAIDMEAFTRGMARDQEIQAKRQAAKQAIEEAQKTQATAVKAEEKAKTITPVENSHGVALTKTEGGRYLIAGHPVTAVFRWMGSQDWTFEDAMTALKNIGIDDVSEGTARIQVGAGKKGGDCGGRGPIPALPADQVQALNVAAGKAVIAPEPKKSPKPRVKKA